MTGVSGSASASYSLNALGQRVKKTASGISTYFVFDEAGHLIGEYDASGNLIQETLWMEDTPIATLRPNGGSVSIFYIHADHLNTPRRISRPSDNAIVWRWDSDPFGTDAPNEDPDADTNLFKYGLRFPGQYFDAETGLSYNYFRDYDPAVGRYVEPDPILQPNRLLSDELAFYVPVIARSPRWLHTYAYVISQPTFESDPLGLGLWKIIKCVWYGDKLDKYNKQCRAECPDDMLGQIKFMDKYQSGAVSDALLKCTCSKAEEAGEGELCTKWLATCISSAVPLPPRPR